jgi:asparagine synthase (glutamine-hydrolysing)
MCGICGFVLSGNAPIVPGVVERMTDTLVHRGPDDSGTWQAEGVGLGHRRLAIIDLSVAGRQPMVTTGMDKRIVFNGEVYNFKELRRELELTGRKFHTQTDTEVVLHAYDAWGADCLSRLNGMFALAIYDPQDQSLFIARDRLGVKPLYYFCVDGQFVFASELKALMVHPAFRKDLDPVALERYFAFKYVPAPFTPFKGVLKLNPGHWLRYHRGHTTTQRWWCAFDVVASGIHPPRPEEDDIHELEDLLTTAVRYRMIADVPLGALLSGGIDSSLVVALMAEQASRIKTFTIGFDDASYDESEYARRIAERLGTNHTSVVLTPSEVFAQLPRVTEFLDEPFGDPSVIPTYLISRFARQQVTVALSGDAGDELFWGYRRYRRFLRAMAIRGIPAPLRKAILGRLSRLPLDSFSKACSALTYNSPIEGYLFFNLMFKGENLDRLLLHRTDVPLLSKELMDQLRELPIHDIPPLLDIHSYLPDDVLTKVDRASMATSLETRGPLLDYRVVEFALRAPFDLKFRRRSQKYLLKRILYKRLDPALFARPKRGFDLPLDRWLRNELRPLLLDHLSESSIKKHGLFNHLFVNDIVKKHMSGRFNYHYMLWTLLMFQLWYERYIVGDCLRSYSNYVAAEHHE